jgi:hypothetical protein
MSEKEEPAFPELATTSRLLGTEPNPEAIARRLALVFAALRNVGFTRPYLLVEINALFSQQMESGTLAND